MLHFLQVWQQRRLVTANRLVSFAGVAELVAQWENFYGLLYCRLARRKAWRHVVSVSCCTMLTTVTPSSPEIYLHLRSATNASFLSSWRGFWLHPSRFVISASTTSEMIPAVYWWSIDRKNKPAMNFCGHRCTDFSCLSDLDRILHRWQWWWDKYTSEIWHGCISLDWHDRCSRFSSKRGK